MPPLGAIRNLDKNIVIALSKLRNPVLTAESFIERDHIQLAHELLIPLLVITEFRMTILCELSPVPLKCSSDSVLGSGSNNQNYHFDSAAKIKFIYQNINETIGLCSPKLNHLLQGGVKLNEITEIVGLSGVGKTQFLFTVAVDAALSGHNILFIDTSNGFSGRRLSEILRHRMVSTDDDAEIHQQILSRIHVVSVFNIFDTMALLDEIIDKISVPSSSGSTNSDDTFSPSMIVLDSVTALIAPLLGGEGKLFNMGQSLLAHLFGSLNRLSHFHCIGVLVSNDARREHGVSTPFDHSFDIKPALGHSWQFLVKTRLLIRFSAAHASEPVTFNDIPPEHSATSACRTITVLKHSRVPSAPNLSAIFARNPEFSVNVTISIRGIE